MKYEALSTLYRHAQRVCNLNTYGNGCNVYSVFIKCQTVGTDETERVFLLKHVWLSTWNSRRSYGDIVVTNTKVCYYSSSAVHILYNSQIDPVLF